jgi:hypothetical protein
LPAQVKRHQAEGVGEIGVKLRPKTHGPHGHAVQQQYGWAIWVSGFNHIERQAAVAFDRIEGQFGGTGVAGQGQHRRESKAREWLCHLSPL